MKTCLASFLFLALAATAADTNALPALAPAYGELPPTFWEHHQSSITIAGFAFLAFVFFFLKMKLRTKNPEILPPEIMACRALAKLQNQPEDGNVLSAASQILRRYVSETFNLPDTGLTTAEFCSALESNQLLGSELAALVPSFLRECDVRKFSPANSASPLNAVSRELELIGQIEKRRSELTAQTSVKK